MVQLQLGEGNDAYAVLVGDMVVGADASKAALADG